MVVQLNEKNRIIKMVSQVFAFIKYITYSNRLIKKSILVSVNCLKKSSSSSHLNLKIETQLHIYMYSALSKHLLGWEPGPLNWENYQCFAKTGKLFLPLNVSCSTRERVEYTSFYLDQL